VVLPEHLSLLRIPAQPSVHPDGDRVAIAVRRLDLDADSYRSDIWVVPVVEAAGAPVQFTLGPRDAAPRWSPDGRWLAFLRGGPDDEPAQLYLMPADGGEPRRVCEHPLGVDAPRWSPDGAHLGYLARVPEDGRYQRGPEARPPGKEPPRRITTLRYRLDNVGFLGDRPRQVFVVDPFAEPAVPVQVTNELWQFGDPTWTPDSRHLVAVAEWAGDEQSIADELVAIPAAGGAPRVITRSSTTAASPTVSADGATVYFLGTDRLDIAGRTIGAFSVPFDGSAAPVRLTDAETHDLHDSHHEGPLLCTPEGLLALDARRGAIELVRVGYAGRAVESLTSGDHQVLDVSVSSGPQPTVAVVVADGASAGELAVVEEGKLRALTSFGDLLAEQADLRPMTEVTASAPDGYPVHGWLVRPSGPGPHPLVLAIHGGPFTQYGYALFDEAQVYAGAGYAVLLGNPRGSSGYGEAHGRSIVGAMGGVDRDDLLALLDAAIAEPDIAGDRVGVMGGSYGGFMTSWLAGHDSHRFRAAISERAVNAWDSFTGSSDIGWYFTGCYTGSDPENTARQSPLRYADSIGIPLLILHSELDWRCPVEQAQRLFVALKLRRHDVELLLFPGEGHELSRSGLPSHRLARFSAILGWWGRHLAPERSPGA
jgi:dipeptidyl aminopeptidase/acylaminoacyl peptidase